MSHFVHPSSIIEENVIICSQAKIWHFCHLMNGVSIGESSSLGQGCFIGKGVEIGKDVKIQNNVSIFEGVSIHDKDFIGPLVVFTNVKNPRSFIDQKNKFKSTVVHIGATIGANCTVICGIEIGRFAFVGAGSVITKDIQDFELWYGNPASHKGWVGKNGERLDFSDAETTTDNKGNTYRISKNLVSLI